MTIDHGASEWGDVVQSNEPQVGDGPEARGRSLSVSFSWRQPVPPRYVLAGPVPFFTAVTVLRPSAQLLPGTSYLDQVCLHPSWNRHDGRGSPRLSPVLLGHPLQDPSSDRQLLAPGPALHLAGLSFTGWSDGAGRGVLCPIRWGSQPALCAYRTKLVEPQRSQPHPDSNTTDSTRVIGMRSRAGESQPGASFRVRVSRTRGVGVIS